MRELEADQRGAPRRAGQDRTRPILLALSSFAGSKNPSAGGSFAGHRLSLRRQLREQSVGFHSRQQSRQQSMGFPMAPRAREVCLWFIRNCVINM